MTQNLLRTAKLKSHSSIPSYLVEGGIVLLLAIATVVINWKMLRDGLNGMTDLKWHITWLQHFSKQLAEGIWYPRWLAGTNYGYGSPTFVFYPPLVFYLGSLIKFSGLSAEYTAIALFSLALFLSGFSFYLFGRHRWGTIAAFVGSLAYMTAPYLALDIYFRGAMASIFVQAWIPLVWWLTEEALLRPKWRVALALSWSAVALTHTPSLLICLIFWLPYTLFFLLNRPWKSVLATIASAGVGLGVASLYLLPAIVEKSLVNVGTLKGVLGGFRAGMLGAGIPLSDLDFNDFVNIPRVFIHQSLAALICTAIAFVWCRQQRVVEETWRWFAFAIAAAFFMSSLSLPIWEASSTLQMVQFPWRFLQLFSFAGAALCGAVVGGIIKLRLRLKLLLVLAILGILLLNFRYSYKLSRQFITLRNPGRGSVEHLEHVKVALSDPYTDKLRDVEEYRPLLGSSPPVPEIGQPRLLVANGEASIKLEQWSSYLRRFIVAAQKTATIRVRTYYYPAWHLYVNNKRHQLGMADNGTIELKLNPGFYTVELRYRWTRAFTIGVVLSILSIIALTFYWIRPVRRRSL